MIKKAISSNPHKRLTSVDDVADFIEILVDYNSSWMTGNIIRIDGLTRSNAKCELGDTVTIRKEKPLLAEVVVLEPITDFAQNGGGGVFGENSKSTWVLFSKMGRGVFS